VESLTSMVGDKGLAQAIVLAASFPHRITASPSLKNDLTGVLTSIGAQGVKPTEFWARVTGAFTAILRQLGDPDERGGAFKPFMQALCAEVATCLESAIGHNTQVISGLKDREAELSKNVADLRQQVVQSEFDLLTQVLNRKGFLKRAQRLATLVEAQGAMCLIGFVDLDDFKQINDSRGHDAGDLALVAVAKRLAGLIRKQGVVGRLGGDEFAFVAFVTDAAGIKEIVERIQSQMCQFEVTLDEGALPVSCSIGVANLNIGAALSPLEESLRRADELMYGAKRAGKGRCFVASPASATAA
jgi:diguanylate cyclase (GGDEF)-like protein